MLIFSLEPGSVLCIQVSSCPGTLEDSNESSTVLVVETIMESDFVLSQ